jgi:thiosulfate/3-mercaptopyruvate sulfurtransferase
MPFDILISAAQLISLQTSGAPLVLLDCGFDLSDTAAGEHAYMQGHLPGAHYAHLDRDLTGAKTGHNGRHPLPLRQDLAARVGQWGIAPGVQVVTYDNQGMPYAARAWWLLRWLGHTEVAVLDGGRSAWLAAGGTLDATRPTLASRPPYPASAPAAMPTIDTAGLQARLGQVQLLDARAGERYRGEVEPLDPVAGHIPGALNHFFKDNLASPTAASSRRRRCCAPNFAALLGVASADVVQQCGSGVTACHNLLAMAVAGRGDTCLYPGSWSEWCSDPVRPVARG